MLDFIDEKLEEFAAACQRYQIERLFGFGLAFRVDFSLGKVTSIFLVSFAH